MAQTVTTDSLMKYLNEIPSTLATYAIRIGLCLLIYFIGTKIINWVGRKVSKSLQNKKNYNGPAIEFLSRLTRVVLKVLLAVILLMQLGLKEATVLAALGSVGVGVGLALQ